MINEYLKFYEDRVQAIKQTIKEQRKAGGKNIEISEIDKFAREEVVVALVERVRQLEHQLDICSDRFNVLSAQYHELVRDNTPSVF